MINWFSIILTLMLVLRKRFRERFPVGEREVLSAGVRIQVESGEARPPSGLGAVGSGEIGGEFLAGALEAATSEGKSGGGDLGSEARGEDDNLAVDFGRRSKLASGDDGTEGDGGEVLSEEGELRVVPWGSGEALGDFFLDEEDDFGGGTRGGEKFLDDGGGDVVGDVAGDDIVLEAGEVELEEILVADVEVFAWEGGGEIGGKAGVIFHGDDTGEAAEEAGGEGAEAWADLEAGVDAWREREVGDLVEDGAIFEPMLAEGFLVFH